jgi:catechol 2,3-dioxygenase-like lactoylglutathione lyase family enzyme
MGGIRGLTGWLGTVLSTPDPPGLARFYSELLGWEIGSEEPTWATIRIPGTTNYLGFHSDEVYEPPVWPSERGRPGQQLHLDVGVADVAAAVEDALALGARLAAYQPQDDVRVMLDPAGHPFCLYLDRG